MQTERSALIGWAVHLQHRQVRKTHRPSCWRKINSTETGHPTSDYPAPFWWLTFPLIHNCSCCPRWTRGWLDRRSCWAFQQPGQFLCSSGWLLSVSDHHHLGTQGEKRQSASIPTAFCTDRAMEKQRRSFGRPAWHLSHNISLLSPASSAAPKSSLEHTHCSTMPGPADTQSMHTSLPTPTICTN